ncbi:Uncharacterized protein OBRU01_06778 [Operophtera brumata]|uniref:Uncharacterized protein n=1 Tax=Operophtera brumata TaxID=104452 RepID=A0A0L7LIG2_OPEBR|nr:Uncharacterized protein OBRU01_06778 [Operophtera brumata]
MVLGTLLSLPFCHLRNEEKKEDIVATFNEVESCNNGLLKKQPSHSNSQATDVKVKERLHYLIENVTLPESYPRMVSDLMDSVSSTFIDILRPIKHCDYFLYTLNCISEKRLMEDNLDSSLFGNRETTVNMLLLDDFSQQGTSLVQATKSNNKCLQAVCDCENERSSNMFLVNSNDCSTSTNFYVPPRALTQDVDTVDHSGVYYLFRIKQKLEPGMGRSGSKSSRSVKIIAAPVCTVKSKPKVKRTDTHSSTKRSKAKPETCSSGSQTSSSRRVTSGTISGSCLKRKKGQRREDAGIKGEMSATILHIQIVPGDPYTVDGAHTPCGPNSREREKKAQPQLPNPRRGVFELVIRRINGTPHPKNELMLEWKHPPPGGQVQSQGQEQDPSGRPYSMIFYAPCQPRKCIHKYCKKAFKKPFGPMPCYCVPYKKCSPPLKCWSCQSHCATTCYNFPCTSPCQSSPCMRPCPFGRRTPRKVRSHPRISH